MADRIGTMPEVGKSTARRQQQQQPARPKRTEKQKQASRANGARSKGPKTRAGKLRCRMNALRHGLISRALPPWNTGLTDRDTYDDVLKNLLEDYQPTTQMAVVHIESLAVNVFRLERVLALQDLLMDRDQREYDVLSSRHLRSKLGRSSTSDLQRKLGLLKKLQQAVGQKAVADFTPAELSVIADHIWDQLSCWQVEVERARGWIETMNASTDADDDDEEVVVDKSVDEGINDGVEEGASSDDDDKPIPNASVESEEQEELREAEEMNRKCGPHTLGVRNKDHVTDIIAGRKQIPRGHRRTWTTRLKKMVGDMEDSINEAESSNRGADEVERKNLERLAANLPKLDTLTRHEEHIRRSMKQDYAALARIREASNPVLPVEEGE